MIKANIIVKIVSPCGTYRETIRCVTMEEANRYADVLRAEGSKVTIKEGK